MEIKIGDYAIIENPFSWDKKGLIYKIKYVTSDGYLINLETVGTYSIERVTIISAELYNSPLFAAMREEE